MNEEKATPMCIELASELADKLICDFAPDQQLDALIAIHEKIKANISVKIDEAEKNHTYMKSVFDRMSEQK